ncbi:MAG: DUF4861 domain-containing protein [Dysgonamonadaceae bacterium]|jgi:hypothetical protein|nr:DUF4861 domain-containing protein [Dysgonamonadaceae bacterium]
MKKIVLFLFATSMLVACSEKSLKIEVANETSIEKINEMVSIPWSDLTQKMTLHEGQSIIVLNEDGNQIPYQILYKGQDIPQKVIFQVSLGAGEKAIYTIKQGDPKEFQRMTYGRAVPERKDDFAWENDRIAFRMYGPALAPENPSNGVDVWSKRTNALIIDKFYKDDLENDIPYHIDNGLGLDCYKVGHSLGAGGIAPYIDGVLHIGNHYTTAKLLDSGELRTSFELTYDAVPAGEGKFLTQKIVISLDAGSQLNKAIVSYDGNFDEMQVAGGIWLHQELGVIAESKEDGYVAYAENVLSDLKANEGKPAGRTYLGVIFPQGVADIKQQDEHLLAIANYKKGEELTYYFGAGWSEWGFDSDQAWFDYIKNFAENLKQSLTVTIL